MGFDFVKYVGCLAENKLFGCLKYGLYCNNCHEFNFGMIPGKSILFLFQWQNHSRSLKPKLKTKYLHEDNTHHQIDSLITSQFIVKKYGKSFFNSCLKIE